MVTKTKICHRRVPQPYLRNLVIGLQKSDTRKSQLKISFNFLSSKDTNEEQVMHSKSDNIEVMIYDNTNEVIEKNFELLLSRYQIGLETSMKDSDFF